MNHIEPPMNREELTVYALTLINQIRTRNNAEIRIGWALDRARGEEPRIDTEEYRAAMEFEEWLQRQLKL